MSLAKNKKIQSILAQASSDSEEDDTKGGGSAFADFSTMKQKVNKKKSNKNSNTTIASTATKVVEVVENVVKKGDEEEEKKSSHPAPAKTKNATKGSSSAPKPTKAAATQGSKASAKKGSGSGDTRTDRKKEAHKKKKDTEEEEERLLNDILSGQGNGEGSEDEEGGSGGASPYHQHGRTGTDVMSLMYTADRKYLDYRHEQAESFGKHAIEDLTGKNMKRLGYVVPKIARTPFSSPNLGNGTWTVLAKPEGAADLVEVKDTSKPTLFSIDATSSEYLKAHHALQFAVETSMGNTEALLKTWQAHPHHLPTVLQLASTFQTLGDVSKTSEFMDIALHLVGNLFSSSRGFNLIDPPTKRQIPFDFDPNKPVFTALSRGVHHVMGKSFAKTSHEICKVLLSLNERDPCGAALLWDYTAIRAREYMSVVELHHTVVGTALRVAGMPTVPSPLVEPMVGLPSLYFSAALSRHVLHTSSTRSAASSSTGGSTAIKGNRTPLGKCNTDLLVRSGGAESPLSSAQNAFPAKGKMPLCGAMSARDAAITAVALFPQSAVDLAAALGEPVAEEPWSSLAFEVDDLKRTSDVFASRCESPLHHIFAQRHSEMWKPVDRIGLLRVAVREVNKSGLIAAIHGVGVSPIPSPLPAATSPISSDSSSTPLDAEVVARASLSHVRELLFLIDEQSDALQSRYGTIPEHYITGKMDGAIPRELLEAMQAEDDQNAMGGRVERLSQQDMMLLERYEAAFGPIEIPGEDRMLPSERLTFYSAQLEDHIRRLGDTYNPISLFFRTILPWNDVREMALRTAFGNANTEDPEVVARRVRREYERQVMDEADALPDGDDAMGPR